MVVPGELHVIPPSRRTELTGRTLESRRFLLHKIPTPSLRVAAVSVVPGGGDEGLHLDRRIFQTSAAPCGELTQRGPDAVGLSAPPPSEDRKRLTDKVFRRRADWSSTNIVSAASFLTATDWRFSQIATP